MSAPEVAEYTGAGSDPATKLIIAQLDGHSGILLLRRCAYHRRLAVDLRAAARQRRGHPVPGHGRQRRRLDLLSQRGGGAVRPGRGGLRVGARRTHRAQPARLPGAGDRPGARARRVRAGDGDLGLSGVPHGDDGRTAAGLHPFGAVLARASGAALPGQRRPHGGAAEHGLPGGAPLLRRSAAGAGRVRRGGRAAHLHAAGAVRAVRAAGDRSVPGRARRRSS